ncbi:hypothetical protein PM082_010049 [Marasmius tenuissimus]|nr:hypothetical protein PM082_010049 [Marasmius tenuissimus]
MKGEASSQSDVEDKDNYHSMATLLRFLPSQPGGKPKIQAVHKKFQGENRRVQLVKMLGLVLHKNRRLLSQKLLLQFSRETEHMDQHINGCISELSTGTGRGLTSDNKLDTGEDMRQLQRLNNILGLPGTPPASNDEEDNSDSSTGRDSRLDEPNVEDHSHVEEDEENDLILLVEGDEMETRSLVSQGSLQLPSSRKKRPASEDSPEDKIEDDDEYEDEEEDGQPPSKWTRRQSLKATSGKKNKVPDDDKEYLFPSKTQNRRGGGGGSQGGGLGRGGGGHQSRGGSQGGQSGGGGRGGGSGGQGGGG